MFRRKSPPLAWDRVGAAKPQELAAYAQQLNIPLADLLEQMGEETRRDALRLRETLRDRGARLLMLTLGMFLIAVVLTLYLQAEAAGIAQTQAKALMGRTAITCVARVADKRFPTTLPAAVTLIASPRDASKSTASFIENDVLLLHVKGSGDTVRATIALTAQQMLRVAPVLATSEVYLGAPIR